MDYLRCHLLTSDTVVPCHAYLVVVIKSNPPVCTGHSLKITGKVSSPFLITQFGLDQSPNTIIIGGQAHNIAKFEMDAMLCNGQKSCQTWSIHSPDGVTRALLPKHHRQSTSDHWSFIATYSLLRQYPLIYPFEQLIGLFTALHLDMQ